MLTLMWNIFSQSLSASYQWKIILKYSLDIRIQGSIKRIISSPCILNSSHPKLQMKCNIKVRMSTFTLCVYAHNLCLVPAEARRHCWILWNFSYICFWDIMWVLATKFRSSAKTRGVLTTKLSLQPVLWNSCGPSEKVHISFYTYHFSVSQLKTFCVPG